VQSVEKILLSVVSMLAGKSQTRELSGPNVAIEPNTESPANVEASKMFRDDRKKYDSIVQACVRATLGV